MVFDSVTSLGNLHSSRVSDAWRPAENPSCLAGRARRAHYQTSLAQRPCFDLRRSAPLTSFDSSPRFFSFFDRLFSSLPDSSQQSVSLHYLHHHKNAKLMFCFLFCQFTRPPPNQTNQFQTLFNMVRATTSPRVSSTALRHTAVLLSFSRYPTSPRRCYCSVHYSCPHLCRHHLVVDLPLAYNLPFAVAGPFRIYTPCHNDQCVRSSTSKPVSAVTRSVPSSGECAFVRVRVAERSADHVPTGKSSPRNMVSSRTVPTREPPTCSSSVSTSTTTRRLLASTCPELSSSTWSPEPWTRSEVVLSETSSDQTTCESQLPLSPPWLPRYRQLTCQRLWPKRCRKQLGQGSLHGRCRARRLCPRRCPT